MYKYGVIPIHFDATRHLSDFGRSNSHSLSTMTDVEMKPAEDKTSDEKKNEEPKPAPISPAAEIKINVALIDRAVSTLEPRFTHRVLRTLTALQKRIDDSVLRDAILDIYPKGASCQFVSSRSVIEGGQIDNSVNQSLLSWLPSVPSPSDQSMEVDSSAKPPQPELVPEAEMYLRLLILQHLLKSEDTQEKALELANESVEKMQALNRRSMDAIAAKIWYAVDRAYELAGELSDARP